MGLTLVGWEARNELMEDIEPGVYGRAKPKSRCLAMVTIAKAEHYPCAVYARPETGYRQLCLRHYRMAKKRPVLLSLWPRQRMAL